MYGERHFCKSIKLEQVEFSCREGYPSRTVIEVPDDAITSFAGEHRFLSNPEAALEAAALICYQCRHNGPPTWAEKGGEGSIVQRPKAAWWHVHPHGAHEGVPIVTECKAGALWENGK